MAKISTYPFPSPPSASDYVIGTDASDDLNTKNFLLSDILNISGSSVYVPYTGAIQSVDLGGFGLSTFNLYISGGPLYTFGTNPGSSGDILTSQGSSLSPIWLSPSSVFYAYVPYLGATADLNLGGNNLYVNNIIFNGGTIIDGNDNEGLPGQVLTSVGGGDTPVWQYPTSSYDPKYGSFYQYLTQTIPIDDETPLEFNVTDISNGVTVINDGALKKTIIRVSTAGVYNIQFSSQLKKTGGASGDILIWLNKNTIPIPWTATNITLGNNNNYYVAAWNWFVNIAPLESIQIMIYSPVPNVILEATLSEVGYSVPANILTVNKIS